MYQISCLMNPGVGNCGNDDRCFVYDHVVSNGSFEVQGQEFVFAGVCDGVGGEAFGDEAAEAVARYMADHCTGNVAVSEIKQFLEEANSIVIERSRTDRAHHNMATTIAGIIVNGNDMLAYNIGDSRIYRYREPYIMQISLDHTLTDETRRLGLQPTDWQNHVITKCLGGNTHSPYIFDGIDRSFERDIYVICSDGISDLVSPEEFEMIMQNDQPLCGKCSFLVSMAIEKGSYDNLSIIIAKRMDK